MKTKNNLTETIMIETFDFIIVLNHNHAHPVKWKGLTREQFFVQKQKHNENKYHVAVVASIKNKK